MELEKVRMLIEEKYDELTSSVAETLKGIALEPDDDAEEAPLPATVWEGFVELVQSDPAPQYTEYDELIAEVCQARLEELTPLELRLLWLGSGGYLDWEEEPQEMDFPSSEELQEDVLDELFSWVEQKAAEDDLEDSEEREAIAYH